MRTILVPISGMTCNGCAAAVTSTLKAVPGIQRVLVRLAEHDAMLTIDDTVTSDAIDAAIERAGFTPGPRDAQA